MISFKEYFLLEGMKTPSELKREQIYFIINRQDERHIQITMYKRPQKFMFFGIMIKFDNLWVFHIDSKENKLGHVYAHKGYGPVMYDMAMELASKYGEGLVTPISIGAGYPSDESINVYKYYYNKRTDIQKTPLDYEKHKVERPNEFDDMFTKNPWLTMLYVKPNPTTLNELESANMIRYTNTDRDPDNHLFSPITKDGINQKSEFKSDFIKRLGRDYNIKPQAGERLFNDAMKAKFIVLDKKGNYIYNHNHPEKPIFCMPELAQVMNFNPYINSSR